jgi:hypothetical protein
MIRRPLRQPPPGNPPARAAGHTRHPPASLITAREESSGTCGPSIRPSRWPYPVSLSAADNSKHWRPGGTGRDPLWLPCGAHPVSLRGADNSKRRRSRSLSERPFRPSPRWPCPVPLSEVHNSEYGASCGLGEGSLRPPSHRPHPVSPSSADNSKWGGLRDLGEGPRRPAHRLYPVPPSGADNNKRRGGRAGRRGLVGVGGLAAWSARRAGAPRHVPDSAGAPWDVSGSARSARVPRRGPVR